MLTSKRTDVFASFLEKSKVKGSDYFHRSTNL